MSGKSVMKCFTYTYMYYFEISFTDISGSNGLILIKFTQLFQWVTKSLETNFQRILIILVKLYNIEF